MVALAFPNPNFMGTVFSILLAMFYILMFIVISYEFYITQEIIDLFKKKSCITLNQLYIEIEK